MISAPQLRLLEARFYERPVRLRLPFRFGVVTLREAPQLFVRARVRLQDGREGEGVAAELLVPKWFDKSPELTNEDNFNQLRRALAIARRHVIDVGSNTAFDLSALADARHRAECTRAGLNGLVASFGLALIERAIIDAFARIEAMPAFELVRANRLGLTAALTPDLDGFDLDKFVAGLEPADSIFVRHTVGLVDALMRTETAGKRLDDGLPESLEEVIAAYGHRYFKLKVGGKVEADIERLAQIAAVLDRIDEPYAVTLDGNEQYDEVGAVIELWRRIAEDKRLARLKASMLHIEQPITRSRALSEPIHALAREVPVEIDESDSDFSTFPRARALGYRGISAKSCKGFYRALLNRARVAKYNAEDGGGYFMSAEDLTTQAGVAVQQDLALAALVGAKHVERNGHHYVDGMAGAPQAEQDAFMSAHGDLYRRAANGRARLHIQDGEVSLRSIAQANGLATSVMPDWRDEDEPPTPKRPQWRDDADRRPLDQSRDRPPAVEPARSGRGLRAPRHQGNRSLARPGGGDRARGSGARDQGPRHARYRLLPRRAVSRRRRGGPRPRSTTTSARSTKRRRSAPNAWCWSSAACRPARATFSARGGWWRRVWRRSCRTPARATCRSPSSRCIRCMPPTAPA